MKLKEKIKDFNTYKLNVENEMAKKAKELEKEFLNYINNKEIALKDRFDLWISAPDDMKKHLDYDNIQHKYQKTFVKFMYDLACRGIEFSVPVNVTESLSVAINNDGLDGSYWSLSEEETIELMEFVLETNIGETEQMEED